MPSVSLFTFQKLLKENPLGTLTKQVFREISMTPSELSKYCTYTPKVYTRNTIFEGDKYKLMLLCWAPNSRTKIHGHDSDCLFKVMSGGLVETRHDYETRNVLFSKKYNEGECSDFSGIHQVINKSKWFTTSLHYYTWPSTNQASLPLSLKKLNTEEVLRLNTEFNDKRIS